MKQAFVCPECGSGKVFKEKELSAEIKCMDCAWAGEDKDLMLAVVPDAASAGELSGTDNALYIAEEVSKAYLATLATVAAQSIGLAMIQSGVVGQQDPGSLKRLIRAACIGAHKATLEEVDTIQKEMQSNANI